MRPIVFTMRWMISVVLLLGVGTAAAQPAVPPLTDRVVDRADLLSNAAEQTLIERLAAHETETGNQIAVLTVESLDGVPIEQYSLEVAREWALGQADDDNGVLLLIARDDREMRIEVGYGLEGDLPDVVASRIIRHELRPAFRKGDYDGGVEAGLRAIIDAIDGTYEPPDTAPSSSPRLVGLLFVVLGVLFGGGAGYLSLMAAARYGWIPWLIILLILGTFILSGVGAAWIGLAILLTGGSGITTFAILLIGLLLTAVLYFWQAIRLIRHPKLKTLRKKAKDDAAIDESVEIWPFTFAASFWTTHAISSGSGSSSSSGFSSSSTSSSSSSSSFSGGGGSFGGGGASGGW